MKKSGNLLPIDIESALLKLVKVVQNEAFKTEIHLLKSHKPIINTSKVLKLAPFLDEIGLIRVGGRIHHSQISYDQKHQMLLPSDHPLTSLIVTFVIFKIYMLDHKRSKILFGKNFGFLMVETFVAR